MGGGHEELTEVEVNSCKTVERTSYKHSNKKYHNCRKRKKIHKTPHFYGSLLVFSYINRDPRRLTPMSKRRRLLSLVGEDVEGPWGCGASMASCKACILLDQQSPRGARAEDFEGEFF